MTGSDPALFARRTPALGVILAAIGTVLITGTAVVRLSSAAITFSWFDVDPATVEVAAWGLLPGMRMVLDALMLAGAALIFAGGARPASTMLLTLGAIPVPLLLWYGWRDPVALEQASLWMASIWSAIALAHAGTDRRLRVIGASIVMAGLALVIVRAVGQVVWEIPSTIAWFEANRGEALAMRGLEPDGSAAQLFERRLRNAAPTAWFSTTNLLASVMAAGAVAMAAIVFATLRAGIASGITGLVGFVSVAMAALVVVSGSLGGLVVLALGAGFLVASVVVPRWSRTGGWIAVALVVAALLAAPLAGLVGDVPGTRSLVIRSGYVAGAAEVVASSPWRGVGPGGFGNAWLSVRSPSSPEEIASPHALPWDWAVAMGIVALPWITLVLMALVWSVRQPVRRSATPSDRGLPTLAVVSALLVVGIGCITTQWSEIRALDDAETAMRVLGWLAFIAGAGGLAWIWSRLEGGLSRGLSAAALVLVVHAQIEMTMAEATTAPWLLAVIGLAAPLPAGGERNGGRGRSWGSGLATSGLVSLAVVIVSIGAWPAWRAERLIATQGAIVNLASRQSSGLVMLAARQSAADALLEAAELRGDDRLRFIAAEQLFAGLAPAVSMDPPAAPAQVEAARQRVVTLAGSLLHRIGSVPAGHLAITALRGSDDPAERRAAIAAAEQVVAVDPAGLWSVRHLADALWEAGERDVAAEVYRRVLRLNQARAIDPLRQLSDSDRGLIEIRSRSVP